MPIRRAVLMMRHAISPRFAMRIFLNKGAFCYGPERTDCFTVSRVARKPEPQPSGAGRLLLSLRQSQAPPPPFGGPDAILPHGGQQSPEPALLGCRSRRRCSLSLGPA